MNDFVHLHVHDEYSTLDGFGKATAYAERAKELGFKSLGLTNHGNIDGTIKFQKACLDAGILPIIGCEGYIVPDATIKEKKEKRGHITILVENLEGWLNLTKILTKANLYGFHRRPRLDFNSVLEHPEGLVFMTGCSSSFLLLPGSKAFLEDLIDAAPGRVFLEVMPHILDDQIKINKVCSSLSSRYGLKLVASNDCHYIRENDNKMQEILLAIQSGAKWKDPDRWRFTIDGLYVKTEQEMKMAFRKQGSLALDQFLAAIKNSAEVAEMCSSFKIERKEVYLPKVSGYEDRDEKEVLLELCEVGIQNKVTSKGLDTDKYRKQMLDELEIINNLGFTRYFLIVEELIKWCKNNNILTGPGRGSVSGCIVAYLLGITQVDSVKFDLNFYRFISPARIDLPDIDMDFQDDKRYLVKKHLEDLYGENRVAGVSTFSTMKGRSALRDVARVFDVPIVDVGPASKAIVVRSGGDFRSSFTIEDAFDTFEDGIKFKKKYPDVADAAMRLEGQVRGSGVHAAACIVCEEDLYNTSKAHLKTDKEGNPIVNWEKEDAEYNGLMKLDLLGLKALTVLASTAALVKQNHGVDVDFYSLPLDDPKVYEEFTLGHTVGVFQFGSLGLRKLCQEVKVDNFNILVDTNALFRPGTLRTGMVTEYVLRKTGQKTYVSKHPFIEEITKGTQGIILYQEQVMKFMYDLGGLEWKTADTVRKVISKSKGVEQFMKFKDMFMDGCEKKKTLDRKIAGELWEELASFGSYSFNRSHSVAYSMIAYYDLWAKVYYPAEFIASSLTYGSDMRKEDVIEEAQRIGLPIYPPKAGISKAKEWVIKGNRLYVPFEEIQGVGEKTSTTIEKYCEDRIYTKSDVSGIKINARIKAILDKVGVFDPGKEHTDEELEDLNELFSFNIVRDPMRKYRTLRETLISKLDIKNVCQATAREFTSKEYYWYFGQMTEIKYGYRASIAKLQSKSESLGHADSLGGVYGNFKDDTDFIMLVFDAEVYNRKKDLVEHCGGDFVLVKARHTGRNQNLMCCEIYTSEELMSGSFDIEGLVLVDKAKRYRDLSLLECKDCELREVCAKPVLPSSGAYNAAIIMEAPGKEENASGIGLTGRSGNILWAPMKEQGLTRDMFHVTSVVKCWPNEFKTPGKKHIAACSKWLNKELTTLKPAVVLALGNTCMKFFKGVESGIMDMNGKTEWNAKYGCWVCWGINPATVLYHVENKELFGEAVSNFTSLIKKLTNH